LCSSSVLTLGMRRRFFSSSRKRGWFLRAKSTAGEAILLSLSGALRARSEVIAENVSVYTRQAAPSLRRGKGQRRNVLPVLNLNGN